MTWGSGQGPSTAAFLQECGLAHLVERVGHLSISQLSGLLISDYPSVGVVQMADKQALYKALQANKQQRPSPQLTPQPSSGGGR